MPVNTNSHMKKHFRVQNMNSGDESLFILSSWLAQMKVKARMAHNKFPMTERMAVIMSMILKFLSSYVSAPWVHFLNYILIKYKFISAFII